MQIIKKAIPNPSVKREINSSPPLSLRLANRSSFPPVIIFDALSALPLCSKTMAINNIDIIISNIFKLVPPVFL